MNGWMETKKIKRKLIKKGKLKKEKKE